MGCVFHASGKSQISHQRRGSAKHEQGQLTGVLISGPVGERYGRKACITIAATFYLLGTILMAANFGSLAELIVGRVLSGLGSGFGMTIGAIYIAEVAPREVRGAMSTMYNFNIMLGVSAPHHQHPDFY